VEGIRGIPKELEGFFRPANNHGIKPEWSQWWGQECVAKASGCSDPTGFR
jgi:hypothetical protein